MEHTQNNRVYGVVGLMVMIAVAVTIVVVALQPVGPRTGGVRRRRGQRQLRATTVELIGYPPDGPESLDDALAIAPALDRRHGGPRRGGVRSRPTSAAPSSRPSWSAGGSGSRARELGGDDVGLVSRRTLELVGRHP